MIDVPLHISVPGKSVPWHKVMKADTQRQLAKTETKPYPNQLSPGCIKKLVDCVEQFNEGVR